MSDVTDSMEAHAEHWPWEQVGPCVYCSCHTGMRLYQGEVPDDQQEARALGAWFDAMVRALVDKRKRGEI